MRATLTKAAVFSALIIIGTHNMYAGEGFSSEKTETMAENVIVNSNPLSPEKRIIWEKMRREEAELEEQALQEEGSLRLTGTVIPIKSHSLNDLVASNMNATAASYSPYVLHWIEELPQENVVKLEDGSEWIFDKSDIGFVRLWQPGHTIIFTAKRGSLWGSNYEYVLTNADKNVSIPVSPFRGSREFGKGSTWVAGINRTLGQIYVINGAGERTVWEISSPDKELFEEWLVNQHVMMGHNDSWFWSFSSYDHIIYNFHMNHYVHARMITGSN